MDIAAFSGFSASCPYFSVAWMIVGIMGIEVCIRNSRQERIALDFTRPADRAVWAT